MLVKQYHSIKDFFQDNLTFLEQEEAVNNLLIGIPFSMMGEKEIENPPNLFSVFKEDGALVFSMVQTAPKNFLIYGKKTSSLAALEKLIPVLKEKNIKTSGVIGPKDLAISFADIWKKYTHQEWHITFEQLIYQLDNVNALLLAAGKYRVATIEDLPIVEKWFTEFLKEAMNRNDPEEAKAIGRSKIESGTLYLWENKVPVSMAAIARPSRNGITINYVYTPPEFRGNGYAKSCVAKLSESMLGPYKFCCLFTDATNPTSNKIYQKIGYYPIVEFLEISFL